MSAYLRETIRLAAVATIALTAAIAPLSSVSSRSSALFPPAPLPATAPATAPAGAARPLCAYVASGEPDRGWTADVERALRARLAGRCRLHVFHLGTAAAPGDAARHLAAAIERLEPRVVIVSGDEVTRQLVVPHLLESDTPIIFAGADWSIAEHGPPPRHVSGVVETARIRPMLKAALLQLGTVRRALHIGADTPAGRRYHRALQNVGESLGITIERVLVDRFDTWALAMESSQHYALTVLGEPAGIAGWDSARAALLARARRQGLSVTNSRALTAHAAVGLTTVAEEHGDWAARTVLAVLDGIPVTRIPLVTSRRQDTWVNLDLMSRARITPDRRLLIDAHQVAQR